MRNTVVILGLLLCAQTIICTGGVHNVEVGAGATAEPTFAVGAPQSHLDRFNPENSPEDRLAFETILNHIHSNEDVEVTGYRFSKVESLSVQLVAGKKYDFTVSFVNDEGLIRYFQVVVWVKIWENFAQVTSFKELDGFKLEEKPIYGGQTPKELDLENNADDIRVYETALKSLQNAHALQSTGFKVKGVSNVSTQLVAGTIYTFDLTFGNEISNEERTFTVRVILIPWQNVCEVISVEEKRIAEPILQQYGNQTPYEFDLENNPVDQIVFGYVNSKAMALLGAENAGWEFLEFRNSYRQIVSGSVYDFDIVYRNLSKEEIVYHAQVYVVPWENKVEVQKFERVN